MSALPVPPTSPSPDARPASTREVWHSRFGPVLIEVIDGVPHVNGEPVHHVAEPATRWPVPPAHPTPPGASS